MSEGRFDQFLEDDRHIRSDLRILEKAVRERWVLQVEERRRLVEKIVAVANRLAEKQDPTGIDRRAMIRLGMLVVAMERASYENASKAMDFLRSRKN